MARSGGRREIDARCASTLGRKPASENRLLKPRYGHYFRRHRQLVGSGQPDLGGRKMSQGLTLPNAADFCPEVEALAPGSSVLGGSNMIATDMKKVVDLIVRRQEAL